MTTGIQSITELETVSSRMKKNAIKKTETDCQGLGLSKFSYPSPFILSLVNRKKILPSRFTTIAVFARPSAVERIAEGAGREGVMSGLVTALFFIAAY